MLILKLSITHILYLRKPRAQGERTPNKGQAIGFPTLLSFLDSKMLLERRCAILRSLEICYVIRPALGIYEA